MIDGLLKTLVTAPLQPQVDAEAQALEERARRGLPSVGEPLLNRL